jgi:hypothetical protein
MAGRPILILYSFRFPKRYNNVIRHDKLLRVGTGGVVIVGWSRSVAAEAVA